MSRKKLNNNYKNNKQYNYKSKNSNNLRKKTTNLEFTNKIKEIDDNINSMDSTTRIRIDDDRLNDIASLDTSFLEGRVSTKKTEKILSREKSNDVKLTNKKNRKKNSRINNNIHRNRIDFNFVFSIFIIVVVCVFALFAIFSFINIINQNSKVKTKVVTKEVVKTVVDENILFLGDSITAMYDLDQYFSGYKTVNSGISGDSTNEIVSNMNERCYRYNPSKVFILIGTNDFDEKNHGEISKEETINNIKEIIEGIKENRKYADIYIESIYPVNSGDNEKISHSMVGDRSNDTIKEYNEEIKKLAKQENVTYIDMYDLLVGEDGHLKLEYTKEGLHINDDGYGVITKELKKYL